MAKLAQVGYGSEGQGDGTDHKGYTYVVNDNVRTGDTIFPAVKHAGNGAIFVTTGKILPKGIKSMKGVEGKKILEELKEKDIEPSNYYTGKELGVQRARTKQGTFQKTVKTGHDELGNYTLSEYDQATRGLNLELLYNQNPKNPVSDTEKVGNALDAATRNQRAVGSGQETYKQYAAKFMGDKK